MQPSRIWQIIAVLLAVTNILLGKEIYGRWHTTKEAKGYVENARYYARREAYDRAIGEYNKALDVSPDSWHIRLGMLKAQTLKLALENDLVGTIRDAELVETLEANGRFLFQNNPTDPELLGLRGVLRSLNDDPGGAEEWFSKALSREPNFAKVYNYRAMNLLNWQLETNWQQRAKESFEKASTLDPHWAWPRINLGYLVLLSAESLEDFKRADSHFEQAEKIDSEIPALYSNWGASLLSEGLLYAEKGDSMEAKKHFVWALDRIEKAIKLNARLPDAQNNWGAILEAMDEYDEAEKHYKLAVSLQPHLLKTHENLGILYEKLGRTRDAIDSYLRWKETAKLLESNLEQRVLKPLDTRVKEKLKEISSLLRQKMSSVDEKIAQLGKNL